MGTLDVNHRKIRCRPQNAVQRGETGASWMMSSASTPRLKRNGPRHQSPENQQSIDCCHHHFLVEHPPTPSVQIYLSDYRAYHGRRAKHLPARPFDSRRQARADVWSNGNRKDRQYCAVPHGTVVRRGEVSVTGFRMLGDLHLHSG